MIRGTTPTIKYAFPFDVSKIVKFRMYFIQGNILSITKTEDDCIFDGNTVSAMLTQEETYGLSAKKLLVTKARFLLDDGTVCGTKSTNIKVEGADTSGSEVLRIEN